MSDAKTPAYSVGTIARLLMLTERQVQNLTKDGVIPKSARGRYELAPAIQGYVRYLRERAIGKHVEQKARKDARTRLLEAQAERAEIENELRIGSLVHADHVDLFLQGTVENARQAFERVAPALRQRNPNVPLRVIADAEELIAQALGDLARAPMPDELREALERAGGPLEDPAADDGEPVG